MKNEDDILIYISSYCSEFMSDNEKAANNHYTAQEKFLKYKGRSDKAGEMYSKLASDDPKVLALLDRGYKAFIRKSSQRIYEEHFNELNLNFCSKCGGIARTPTAKQCRYCSNNWH